MATQTGPPFASLIDWACATDREAPQHPALLERAGKVLARGATWSVATRILTAIGAGLTV